MSIELIANEVMRGAPHDTFLAIVTSCAEGMGYTACDISEAFHRYWLHNGSSIPSPGSPDSRPRIHIDLLEKVPVGDGLIDLLKVGYIVTTPLLPYDMRVKILCNDMGEHAGFLPSDVGAEIMRHLLRAIEGDEQADAWQPKRGKLTADFAPVLQSITLPWRISHLINWVADFRRDTNADILLYHSEAKGYIDIYNEYPHPMVGMRCDRPVNGAIELTPYILEGATPSAIAELQRWHDALKAAAINITLVEVDPAALGIRAKQLGIRTDTLIRWERILQSYLPKGLTQVQIAELEDRDIETIKDDYQRMREKGLLPPLPEKPTPKLTP